MLCGPDLPSPGTDHHGPSDLSSMMSIKKRLSIDDPVSVSRIVYLLYGICVLLLVADFFVPTHGQHFGVEGVPGFYAIFGFVSFVLIVLAGKLLRKVIMREEDYYDQ